MRIYQSGKKGPKLGKIARWLVHYKKNVRLKQDRTHIIEFHPKKNAGFLRSDELLHDQSLCWIGDSMNHVSRVEMISPNCWSKPWTVDTISCRYMRFARSEEQILCGLICMSCHVMCFFWISLYIITRYYQVSPDMRPRDVPRFNPEPHFFRWGDTDA